MPERHRRKLLRGCLYVARQSFRARRDHEHPSALGIHSKRAIESFGSPLTASHGERRRSRARVSAPLVAIFSLRGAGSRRSCLKVREPILVGHLTLQSPWLRSRKSTVKLRTILLHSFMFLVPASLGQAATHEIALEAGASLPSEAFGDAASLGAHLGLGLDLGATGGTKLGMAARYHQIKDTEGDFVTITARLVYPLRMAVVPK